MAASIWARSKVGFTRTAVLLGLVAAWEVAGRAGALDPLTWSRPSVIGLEAGRLVNETEFIWDVESSILNIAYGFSVGVAAGALVGATFSRAPTAIRGSLLGWLAAVQGIPFIVFYPVLLTVFGLTRMPIVSIVALVVFIPVTLSVAIGLSSISNEYLRLSRVLLLSRRQAILKIYLPAAVPLVFPGLRLGFSLALISTIGMEFIVASKGLGYRVAESYHAFAVEQMYAVIVWICAGAVVVNSLLSWVEGRLRQDAVTT